MSNSMQTASDRTFLAAAILAAGAFVISLLQLVLQYISSSETQNKCNRAAINFSEKDVTHKWSFRSWKLKVYYPELDMSCFRILEAMQDAWEYGIDYSNIKDFAYEQGMWWHILHADDEPGWRNISDELTALAKDSDQGNYKNYSLIKDSELRWRKRLRFWWWRYRHPLKLMRRPRASWSQIITAFGIRNTKLLKRRVIDADTIPASMDVPFQYVELSQLGRLCVVMGFKDIIIDPVDRNFYATGPSRTITTQEIPTFGKVLRFDGDTFAINYTVVRANSVEWMGTMANISCGAMFFGRYMCGHLVHLPIDLLAEAIGLDSSISKFDEDIKKFIESDEDVEDGFAGNLLKEAHNFQDLMTGLQKSQNCGDLSPEYPVRPSALIIIGT
ncbi:hypothetical protein TSTA_094650 [Talaromyces stipitatus ATCC 10500]|uniref:Uncharacterized protein n=1 Tax=Talaromyces stipitatus (strain ATCC 10500 / CBS 375.48 / QM 6759 / NRRL 1006) TaxID=441959 RepID=B8M2W4_TALSN|nr:uncharacterized protein TSTA_094650 [Talaromyces stipitatus ATCC 10500]EED22219.1 hypothetical protein TSTA_094650 [Talaromyces stipitatus ATCC 10500]